MIALIAFDPKPHPAVEPTEPPVLPDHHEGAIDAPGHSCGLRLLAICCVCGSAWNWCDAVEASVDVIRSKAFRCRECRP